MLGGKNDGRNIGIRVNTLLKMEGNSWLKKPAVKGLRGEVVTAAYTQTGTQP